MILILEEAIRSRSRACTRVNLIAEISILFLSVTGIKESVTRFSRIGLSFSEIDMASF